MISTVIAILLIILGAVGAYIAFRNFDVKKKKINVGGAVMTGLFQRLKWYFALDRACSPQKCF